MGSMNWLGFSLSSQELSLQAAGNQEHSQSSAAFNSEEVSGECFDLTSDTAAHSLNHLPPSFAIFEAFNRNTSTPHKYHYHIQDWNIIRLKGLEEKYKSSERSGMAMASSCSGQNLDKSQQEPPKLENFLGRHSLADHQDHHTTSASVGDYMFSNVSSLQLPADQTAETSTHGVGASSSIGLSMIKTWLRNQPITPSQNSDNNDNDSGASGGTTPQSLSLSMSSLLAPNESCSSDNRQPNTTTNSTGLDAQSQSQSQTPPVDQAMPRKSIDTFGQRTSIYRGVTRHRWTGRYEAHLWDNSCRREGQTRKGRQVYLGGYDKEEKAARAYDLAALKYWGTTTTTNFPITNYEKELEEMKHMTRQEYVASLRRKSSGFSRGASIYRGVTRHHQHGRWQARIGRVSGNKDLYLGTFSTQEEAAEAYDIAAIKFRGLNAVTNFDMSRYDVKSILESSTLPIGGAAKRLKEHVELQPEIRTRDHHGSHDHDDSSHGNGITNNINVVYGHGWPNSLAFHNSQPQPQPYSMHYPYYGSQPQGFWCKQEQDSDASHCQANFLDLHQLQLGINTHNLFPSSAANNLHNVNIMTTTVDASANSIDNSCGSNSVSVYGGDHGYGGSTGSSGYVIPMATTTHVIANDYGNQNQICNGFSDENQNVLCSADPYHVARNLYGYSSGGVLVKASTFVDQGNANWVPTAVPRSSSSNVALCPGAPPFALLHD